MASSNNEQVISYVRPHTVKKFELIEMCRSGAIAMERGNISYDIN